MIKRITAILIILCSLAIAGCKNTDIPCSSQQIKQASQFQDDTYIWENWTYSPNRVND